MFSLKALRFYEQPPAPQYSPPTKQASLRPDASESAEQESTWSQIERRTIENRRVIERREQQHATFLDTRKIQGRRRSTGRRATDKEIINERLPISIKG